MHVHRRIGLVFDFRIDYCRQILSGIRQYALRRPNWILFNSGHSLSSLRQLAKSEPEGVIAFLYGKTEFRFLRKLCIPIVNVCGVLPDSLPRIGLDDDAIGVLAAEHFAASGLKNLAIVGHEKHHGAIRRERGFCRRGVAENCNVFTFRVRDRLAFEMECSDWTRDANFLRWLRELPKPVGVFTIDDAWGFQLASTCQLQNLAVPGEVAILGLDNDELVCGLAKPQLSSIAIPSQRIGWEAARVLESILRQDEPQEFPILLPPCGIVMRDSSGLNSISDPTVAQVVQYIQKNACESISVSDILQIVDISRSTLERLFKAVRGKTISEEIRDVKFERAKELLIESSAPMHEIAVQCGFTRVNQFCVAFRKSFQCTPTEYRSRHRLEN